MKYARSILDDLTEKYNNKEPLYLNNVYFQRKKLVEIKYYRDAMRLYNIFCKDIDYKLRIENRHIQIYSNDLDWIKKVKDLSQNPLELWTPRSGINLSEKTIILKRKMPYEYRITLGSQTDPNLAKWIRNNPDKAKATDNLLGQLENNGYTKGLYFYVKNEKILDLLSLFVSKPQRIDRIIYESDMDK